MRKQPIGFGGLWSQSLEAGDRIVHHMTNDKDEVWDLYKSTGWYKARSNELSYRVVKPPHPDAKPICENNIWYWVWEGPRLYKCFDCKGKGSYLYSDPGEKVQESDGSIIYHHPPSTYPVTCTICNGTGKTNFKKQRSDFCSKKNKK